MIKEIELNEEQLIELCYQFMLNYKDIEDVSLLDDILMDLLGYFEASYILDRAKIRLNGGIDYE